ncbi:enoyl-CoA hydratase/isomerase family protein [Aeromicrobium wangtongii]|uniref:Enoyl-CoA hydratase-related protein n=1 Tax=Aeromicrobium wangtongii TaxID=2969247 RepID=A0ABY5MEN3_9ACTN|nr:enoyl-CoA hydratase-related protein [Aeromicrobium wangtongii]MCD9197678.1 enoyl-CoA hydratase-related protein [Aeromicrobium wangtongii]UUP15163.1 enoyl-CoA hydratase-related protein [Aeromicrobium wangtongii]
MTNDSDRWVVERDGAICMLRFNGGPRRTVTIGDAADLAALLAARADREAPPVLILVLDVLHADLTEVREMANGRPINDWAPWVEAISAIENYPSAVIVAVPVQASCGGLEMSVAADIRIAAPDALLGVMETRMGILPGAGGTQRLPELVGRGDAALLVLSGDLISGTEAHRMGLVQLLADDPVDRALQLAARLAQIGPSVLRAAKRALAGGRARTADGFRNEGRAFLSLVGSDSTKARLDGWLSDQENSASPALDRGPLP